MKLIKKILFSSLVACSFGFEASAMEVEATPVEPGLLDVYNYGQVKLMLQKALEPSTESTTDDASIQAKKFTRTYYSLMRTCKTFKTTLSRPDMQRFVVEEFFRQNGNRSFQTAHECGFLPVIIKAIKTGAVAIEDIFHNATPLHHAAIYGNLNAAIDLIIAGANVKAIDEYGNKPFAYAAMFGNMLVELCLQAATTKLGGVYEYKAPAIPNFLLHRATTAGFIPLVEALIRAGHDVNLIDEAGHTPLEYAACDVNLTQILLRAGAKPQDYLLHKAAKNEFFIFENDALQIQMVSALIEANVSVDSQDTFGFTALHHAITKGNLRLVKLLIESHANVNIKTIHNETVIHLAIKSLRPLLWKTLTARESVMASREQTENLDDIIKTKVTDVVIEMITLLARAGASLNERDRDAKTPLQLAITEFGQYPTVIETLKQLGAV